MANLPRPLPLALVAALLLGACRDGEKHDATEIGESPLELSELLGKKEDIEGFERAIAPRPFHFPEDHGPHPSFRTEWWYFTGNLVGEQGRRFGYQLTIFRNALAPADAGAPRASHWASTQVYMGNFAVSDIGGNRFDAFDRFERAALGLAGASASPFRVWIADWSVAATSENAFPVRLKARRGAVAVDLFLEEGRAPLAQGNQGLSQKGPDAGEASYYYSLPRMPTQGTVQLGNRSFRVEGLSWMDREWSTSSLGKSQVGWDWFALQLSNGNELMVYQLRRADGRPDPFSAGALIEADGKTSRLSKDDIQIDVTSRWRSPKDGRSYPAGWKLQVPSAQLMLQIAPYLENQELNLAVRYWEGAVGVTGQVQQSPVSGSGYVELTGYGS